MLLVYKGQKFKQYVEEKMQFMFGNGRTQSNMCLKSVREIIFQIDINDSKVAFFMF